MLGAITFMIFGDVRHAAAQQSPPDLRMLLNLDLFSTPSSSTAGTQSTAPSMLEQIRTLNSMGYLAGANDPSDTDPGSGDAQPAAASDNSPSQETSPNQPDMGGGVPQE